MVIDGLPSKGLEYIYTRMGQFIFLFFFFFFFSKIKNIQFQGFVDEIDLWSIGQSVVRTRVNEKTFSDALFEPNPFGIIFIKILWEFPLYFVIG